MADLKTQSPPPSPDQPVPAEFDLICEECGYSLVGLIHSNRCPECGREFDPNDLPLARVPWLYRVRLGKLAAFRATAVLILFGPRAFAAELCRPVRISLQDARRFRALLILLFTLTSLVAVLSGAALVVYKFSLVGMQPTEYGFVGCGVLSALALGRVFIFLATDLPTFIWRGLSSNPLYLTPLHYYAAAPVAMLPFAVAFVATGFALWVVMPQMLAASITLNAIGALIALVMIVQLWVIPLIFMRVSTGCSRRRVLALALYLPLHWLMILMMCFFGWFAAMMAIGKALHID